MYREGDPPRRLLQSLSAAARAAAAHAPERLGYFLERRLDADERILLGIAGTVIDAHGDFDVSGAVAEADLA